MVEIFKVLVGYLVVLGLTYCGMVKFSNDFKSLVDMTQVFANLAIVFTVMVSIYLYLDRQSYDISCRTLDLMDKFDSSEMRKARTLSIKIKKHQISGDALLNEIKNSDELEESLKLLFNFFSKVEVSIDKKIVDKKQIIHSLGAVIIDIIERFEVWTESREQPHIEDVYIMLSKFKRWNGGDENKFKSAMLKVLKSLRCE